MAGIGIPLDIVQTYMPAIDRSTLISVKRSLLMSANSILDVARLLDDKLDVDIDL